MKNLHINTFDDWHRRLTAGSIMHANMTPATRRILKMLDKLPFKPSYVIRFHAPPEERRAILSGLKDQCQGQLHIEPHTSCVYLERDSDAAFFKLAYESFNLKIV